MTALRSLRVSEIFESIQGEGASAGEPSLFLRLASCNLKCTFCDTKYTWDWSAYDYEAEVRHRDIGCVLTDLVARKPRRLIVTGGEPLLQQRALEPLFEALSPDVVVEIETNGTVPPRPELLERVDHWNVSPKLSSSGEPEEKRVRPRALGLLRDTGRASLKLVVREDDLSEADSLVASLAWPRERVVLMPEATSRSALAERGPLIAAAALSRRVRYSSRLHIELYGGKRGV